MLNDHEELIQLFRTDSLTGVGNMISFYECLNDRTENEPNQPFSIISADICGLKTVNDDFGRSAGDSALRWFSLVLKEETDGQVFRLGGDAFAVIIPDTALDYISRLVEKLSHRMDEEGHRAHLKKPAANLAVIQYEELTDISLNHVMSIFYHVLDLKKENPEIMYEVYEAKKYYEVKGINSETLDMVKKLAQLGKILDSSFKMANTDALTELPNMNAANKYLDNVIKDAETDDSSFAILLIDGDNLSQYNEISYILGDNMIRKLGKALHHEMRPDDFLARWRSGDEFFICLRDSAAEKTEAVGNRLRKCIKQVSQDWQFPITISIGAVCYPYHGINAAALIDGAEMALRQAKTSGKDCMFIPD